MKVIFMSIKVERCGLVGTHTHTHTQNQLSYQFQAFITIF